ncbi:MAG TPA: lipid asymmetry maintenance ABC transporter permease subunit MlaE [Gammaproteobacteria bacterium]|nr:lipid asymmetry maintenance ABC transporter permease subunit MlaE [Gammaproteobacteria bacterium]
MRLVRELRDNSVEFLTSFGSAVIFFLRLLAYTPRALLRPRLVLRQVYVVGAESLVLIMMAGLFVGMVLGLQFYTTMAKFGAEQSLGAVVVLALVRELGPVVTALLFAGRAGTALASEIGLMKATEQLSGMEMMAVDPVRYVIVPRFLGAFIAMPLLTAIFNAIAILGSWWVAVQLMGLDNGQFWSPMPDNVDVFDDVLGGVLKSVFFGAAAGLLAVFEGFRAYPTAEGVSRATTRTVVMTAMAVLVLDYMLTAILI